MSLAWTRDNTAAMRAALADTHAQCAGRADEKPRLLTAVRVKQRINSAMARFIISTVYGTRAWSATQLLSPTRRTQIVMWLLFVVLNWATLFVVFVMPFVTFVALYDILPSVEIDMYELLRSIY